MSKTAKASDVIGVRDGRKSELPPIKPLTPIRLAEPDFSWREWQATVPSGTPRETLLDGRYWMLCSPRIRRGDRIAWRTDCLTAFGELIVVACDNGTGDLEVRELWAKQVDGAAMRETERCGYTPKDLGVHDGWGIFRDADGVLLQKNIPSFNEAMRRIKTEHIGVRNAPGLGRGME